MPERNPRTDPRPGDVLRGEGEKRTVIPSAWDRFVNYRERGLGYQVGNVSLDTWRKWAATAEVVKRGQDA